MKCVWNSVGPRRYGQCPRQRQERLAFHLTVVLIVVTDFLTRASKGRNGRIGPDLLGNNIRGFIHGAKSEEFLQGSRLCLTKV